MQMYLDHIMMRYIGPTTDIYTTITAITDGQMSLLTVFQITIIVIYNIYVSRYIHYNCISFLAAIPPQPRRRSLTKTSGRVSSAKTSSARNASTEVKPLAVPFTTRREDLLVGTVMAILVALVIFVILVFEYHRAIDR